MGQSYRGTQATFLDDAMFKMPYELMGAIVDKKDKEIQSDIDQRTALGDLLKAQGLQADEPRLQQKLKEYQDQIDSSVQEIYKDPLNYNKQGVQKLKRGIIEDFTLGEIGAIQSNKARYDAWVKSEEEKIAKNPGLYDTGMFEAIKSQKLKDFTGTSYKGPNDYSSFEVEGAIGIKDTLTVLDDLMKGAIPNFESVSWDNDRGGWNVKGKNESKFFRPEDLQSMYSSFLSTNPDYYMGIVQRQKYGIPGYENSITSEGLNTSPGTFFGESLNLLQTKYGGVQSSTERGTTMNTLGIQQAQDQIETVYVDATLEEKQATVYTAFSGKDIGEFNLIRSKNTGIKTGSVASAIQVLIDTKGYSNLEELERDPAMKGVLNAIRKGDFSSITDQSAGKSLQKDYRQAELQLGVQRAVIASFKKEYPNLDPSNINSKGQFVDPTTGDSKEMTGPAAFDKYLKANAVKPVDVTMSWKPTGITKKQMDNVAKQVIDNGLHMSTPITMPKGMTITNPTTGVKTNVGEGKYSLNDLISLGLLPVEKKEIGRIGLGPTQIITYSDGVNTLNFTTGSTGVIPIWAANDSNKIDYGLKVKINGQEITTRLSNINTDAVDNIMSTEEGLALKGTRFYHKLGGAKNYTIPNGPTIYKEDVLDANGKRIRKAGDVVFNGRVSSINDKNTAILIGQLVD